MEEGGRPRREVGGLVAGAEEIEPSAASSSGAGRVLRHGFGMMMGTGIVDLVRQLN